MNDTTKDNLTRIAKEVIGEALRIISDDRRYSTDEIVELARLAVVVLHMAQKTERLRTMPYAEYLQTPEWKSLASERKMMDRYYCQRCRRREGQAGVVLHTHHKTYARRGNELLDDLETLCAECHAAEHGLNPDDQTSREEAEIANYLRKTTSGEAAS